jgi:hypothetical protein
MKLLKGVVLLKIPKPTYNTANSNTLGKIPYNYTDCTEGTSNSSNNLAFSFDGSKNNIIQATPTVDINANLTVGQSVIHKVFVSNKFFSSIFCVSPELEQNITINKIASEILPIVNHNFLANHDANGFVNNHDNAPQRYQDMYKDEFEEIFFFVYYIQITFPEILTKWSWNLPPFINIQCRIIPFRKPFFS